MSLPRVPAKNNTVIAAFVVIAALVVAAVLMPKESAATTLAPPKDRTGEVILAGNTVIVEITPVFAITQWADVADGKTIIRRIAQTIPMTAKPVIADGKTATVQIQNNRRSEVIFGKQTIAVEIAADNASRTKGLSARQTISGGMLFVYNAPRTICLWMKNTYIALEALFLDAGGNIINTAQMIPHTETTHCSAKAAKYALELPAHWRRQNNAEDADKVILPQKLSTSGGGD